MTSPEADHAPLSIRASSLAADCTKRWACEHPIVRQDIEAVTGGPLRSRRPHVGGIVGGGGHAGFAELNRALRDTGMVGGEARVRAASEVAVAEVERRVDEAGGDILVDDVTPDADQARRQVSHVTEQWHGHQRPDDAPELIEQGLSGRIANTRVTGTPDLWAIDGVLSDAKGGKRPPRVETHAPQQGAYSMLLRARKRPVKAASLVWLPRTKKPKPIAVLSFDIAAAERAAFAKVRFLAKIVEDFHSAVSGELGQWWQDHPTDVIPENPQSFLCAADWCSAWGTNACVSWRLKV